MTIRIREMARTALDSWAPVSVPVESRISFNSAKAVLMAVSRSRFGWVAADSWDRFHASFAAARVSILAFKSAADSTNQGTDSSFGRFVDAPMSTILAGQFEGQPEINSGVLAAPCVRTAKFCARQAQAERKNIRVVFIV